MTAADYEAAVARRPRSSLVTAPVPPTPWNPTLREAMERHRAAVYEEEVRSELLGELRVQPSEQPSV